MPVPVKGDKVEVQGYLNGKRNLSPESKIYYQTTLSITDLIIV